jgi:hypothetical protein
MLRSCRDGIEGLGQTVLAMIIMGKQPGEISQRDLATLHA